MPHAHARLLTDGVRRLGRRPASGGGGAGRRPPALRMSAGAAIRTYGGGGAAQGHRLQALTVGLHEDVLYAEQRLRQLQSLQLASIDPAQSPAWVRRALARMPPRTTAVA